MLAMEVVGTGPPSAVTVLCLAPPAPPPWEASIQLLPLIPFLQDNCASFSMGKRHPATCSFTFPYLTSEPFPFLQPTPFPSISAKKTLLSSPRTPSPFCSSPSTFDLLTVLLSSLLPPDGHRPSHVEKNILLNFGAVLGSTPERTSTGSLFTSEIRRVRAVDRCCVYPKSRRGNPNPQWDRVWR